MTRAVAALSVCLVGLALYLIGVPIPLAVARAGNDPLGAMAWGVGIGAALVFLAALLVHLWLVAGPRRRR